MCLLLSSSIVCHCASAVCFAVVLGTEKSRKLATDPMLMVQGVNYTRGRTIGSMRTENFCISLCHG